MEWILLASIIIGIAQSIATSNYTNHNVNKVRKHYSGLISEINKDAELMNQLEAAYRNKDASLIQSLLNASPFSSDVKNMRQELKSTRSKIKDLAEKKVSTAEQSSQIQQEYETKMNKSQSTGSIIGDLLKGGVSTDDATEYQGSGYTNTDLQEANRL